MYKSSYMLETPKTFCTFRAICNKIYSYVFLRKNQKDETMDNQQERFDLDLSWLAGIVEGEGWVSLTVINSLKRNGKYYPAFVAQIGVSNTDEKLMNKVKDIFDTLGLKYRKREVPAYVGKDGASRKKKWEFSVFSKYSVVKLSNAILPFMCGEKSNRIKKLFDFYKIREEKPKSGVNSAYGKEEYDIYRELYSYRGKSRSKILNDYTLDSSVKGNDIV